MAETTGARSTFDLGLGQVAETSNPNARLDMQGVINALHILNTYANSLANAVQGGGDSGGDTGGLEPSASMPFADKFISVSGQDIKVGNIVCTEGGVVYKGVLSSQPLSTIEDPAVTVGSTGTRDLFKIKFKQAYVALTDSPPGQTIEVGVGPGILKVTGAKCGQIAWGADYRTIYTVRGANTLPQNLVSRNLTGYGDVFLSNPIEILEASSVKYTWEGLWQPGFPYNSGGNYNYNRVFFYPIGVCIRDDYILISDYVRGDSPIHQIIK